MRLFQIHMQLLLFCLVTKSCPMTWTWPHELQPTRSPCPSPSPRVCPSSHPLNQWCHPTFSSSATLLPFCFQSFPASVFCSESALHIRWPRYWSFSFSISPSNEYSGLTFLRIDLFDLLESKGLSRVFSSISSLVVSLLYGATLPSIHDYWKDNSFDYMDPCQQSDVFAF